VGLPESVLLDVWAEGVDDVIGVGRSAGLGVETVDGWTVCDLSECM